MQELVEKRAELRKAFDRVMPDIQEFNNVYVGAGVMKLLKKILILKRIPKWKKQWNYY